MAKVIFEFDENEDLSDINIFVNRHKIMSALYELQELHRLIYNGKIYDDKVIVVKDNKVLTDDDFKNAKELYGEYPISGTKHYLDEDYIEQKLDDILHDVYQYLD